MLTSPLLVEARSLAAQAAWGQLCALLGEARDSVQGDVELVTLYAEGLLRTGQPREARHLLEGTLPQFKSFDGHSTVRRAVNLCGAAHFELGELDVAERAFERAAELARLEGDDLLAAQASNNLAMIANIHGRHEEALALYRVALPAYQRLGNSLGLATSFHNMAITYRDTALLDDADEYERRAADCAREAGDERMLAIAMMGRADLQLQRGDASMAEATALYAIECLTRVPDPAHRADALRLAGVARARRATPADALPLLDEAVQVARGCGAALIEGESLRARAEVALRNGDPGMAREDGQAALILFARLKASREEASMAAWLAELPNTAS